MAMWRMVLATIIYLPVAAVYWSKIDWRKWRPLMIVAFCGSALPNFFFAIAQQHVNSSLAGALNALTPLFTLVIGASFFKMKVSWSRFWGIVVGLSGAMMLILLNSSTTVSGSAFFAFLCVLATVCYAINANAVGHHLQGQHPAAISSAAFMITGGFDCCLAASAGYGGFGIRILSFGTWHSRGIYTILLAASAQQSAVCDLCYLFASGDSYVAGCTRW
jgi:drug/metabolite transporter (DMT)-like permease